MGMLQEFKAFAMRGNVVDLAVGVVIGGAFGKIVTALVEKIIMPITGFFLQGKSVADFVIYTPLPQAAIDQGIKPASLGVGAFAQSVIDFIIVAFAIFMMIKALNAFQKKKEEAPEAPPPTPEDIQLLREIRDSLAKSSPRRAE
jgi:large conductance mechanosensitive channel